MNEAKRARAGISGLAAVLLDQALGMQRRASGPDDGKPGSGGQDEDADDGGAPVAI